MAAILIGITTLFTAAWCVTSLLRRGSAALRHSVWTCAILAALLLPVLRLPAPQHIIERPLPVVADMSAPAISVRAAPSGMADWSILEVALSIWVFGAAIAALRLLLSVVRLRRVIRTATPNTARPIPILISRDISGPIVTGVLHPAILLPDIAATWTGSRRRAVLAHEIAHIRRRDPLILAAAHAATIAYWFHPLCWLAAARLRAESERACDDAVLRIGLRPSGYAGHLLELARTFHPQLAIPMAATSHLESRVKSILDPSVNRSFAARRTWLTAALITAALTGPLAMLSLRAQQPAGGGDIAGIVSDETGAVVPGAELIAFNTEGKNRETAITRPDGAFAFHNIPAGHYNLEVFSGGFAVLQKKDLVVVNGGTLRTNAVLQVGAVSERIVVSAQRLSKPTAQQTGASPVALRVGGMVQAAKLIRRVKPVYPADLQAQGVEGTVLLTAIISKDGDPLSLTVQNTAVNPEFVSAAMDAVRQWRYNPTLLNGEPVEIVTTVTVDFRLR